MFDFNNDVDCASSVCFIFSFFSRIYCFYFLNHLTRQFQK